MSLHRAISWLSPVRPELATAPNTAGDLTKFIPWQVITRMGENAPCSARSSADVHQVAARCTVQFDCGDVCCWDGDGAFVGVRRLFLRSAPGREPASRDVWMSAAVHDHQHTVLIKRKTTGGGGKPHPAALRLDGDRHVRPGGRVGPGEHARTRSSAGATSSADPTKRNPGCADTDDQRSYCRSNQCTAPRARTALFLPDLSQRSLQHQLTVLRRPIEEPFRGQSPQSGVDLA